MALRVRTLTEKETLGIQRLSRSRTAAAWTVERARIIASAAEGTSVPVVAAALGVSTEAVRRWLKRFNAHGLAGLEDAARSGRPPTSPPAQVSTLRATVLSKPAALGLPCANWTLARLVAYRAEEKRIAMKRSRGGELLRAEGMRWRTQEPWFSERVDPAFAALRGPSSSSAARRRRTASSWAWTN